MPEPNRRGGKRPGAGRPAPEGPRVPVSLRLPQTAYAELESRVKATGKSRGDVIAELLLR